VQATLKVHLTKRGDQWVFGHDDRDDRIIFGDNLNVYCENDHQLDHMVAVPDCEAIERAVRVRRQDGGMR
jgi:hypothetical protein